jgi:hypothetical protein
VCNVVLLCHAETIMNRRNRSLCLVYPLSSSVLLTEHGRHTPHLQDRSITKHCKPVPKHRQPITPHSRHTNPQTSGDAQYTLRKFFLVANTCRSYRSLVHSQLLRGFCSSSSTTPTSLTHQSRSIHTQTHSLCPSLYISPFTTLY